MNASYAGLIGALELYQWLDATLNGDRTARTVVVQLLSEDHSEVVLRWVLQRARIVRHVSGPLDARGKDVAIEELTLAYERLEME